jgi:hypothetical protein
VAKPSGNNRASFGGNEVRRIVNGNILLCKITSMGLETFNRYIYHYTPTNASVLFTI